VKTPPRTLLAPFWLAILAALVLAVACGGGDDDDDNGGTGQLSDPQNVPTASPWAEPPEVILLDPDNIQPLPTDPPAGSPGGGDDGGDDGGEPTEAPVGGEPGVCGDTYTVVAEDTTFGIAEKCGVNPDDIISANPDIGDGRSLTVGQVLIMPEASGDSEQ
jgi:hypothetical protein